VADGMKNYLRQRGLFHVSELVGKVNI